MDYAFPLYHIALGADPAVRAALGMPRRRLYACLAHSCRLQGCDLVAAGAAGGQAHMLAMLNPAVSLTGFARIVKGWTSAWLSPSAPLWEEGFLARHVSPEDRAAAARHIACGVPSGAGMARFSDAGLAHPGAMKMPCCCHAIFTTARAKMVMRTNFQLAFLGGMRQVCAGLGAKLENCAAARNHVHALCDAPAQMPMARFVWELRARLLEWMGTNRHYRNVEGWSDESWAYTVSPWRVADEEADICHQAQIHPRLEFVNEMVFISNKLGVPYNTSLH